VLSVISKYLAVKNPLEIPQIRSKILSIFQILENFWLRISSNKRHQSIKIQLTKGKTSLTLLTYMKTKRCLWEGNNFSQIEREEGRRNIYTTVDE
jgi:hypothetical protein